MAKILSYTAALEQILTAFKNQFPDADIAPGSVVYALATAQAAAVAGLYHHQDYIMRQILPDSAEGQYLDRHAYIEGLVRKPAEPAGGTVTLSGQNGTVVPSGLSMAAADGTLFNSLAGGTIAAGVLAVSTQALKGGVAGNIASGAKLTLQSPPPGIDSAALSAPAFTGGSDVESDTALRARVLDKRRKPPAGGNANDYRAWALEMTGVADTFVYPLRLGLGSTSVVVLTSGSGGARIPAQGLLDLVTAHLNDVRPVACPILQVFGPTAKPQAVTTTIAIASGFTFATVQARVVAAITDYIGQLAPLETLRLSKLFRVIMTIEGVDNCAITVPGNDVAASDLGGTSVEMITPGAITVTLA
jgi:uncharacterized phage protein gp47/JayE